MYGSVSQPSVPRNEFFEHIDPELNKTRDNTSSPVSRKRRLMEKHIEHQSCRVNEQKTLNNSSQSETLELETPPPSVITSTSNEVEHLVEGQVSSFEVFTRFLQKKSDGSFDASGIFTYSCYKTWLNTRKQTHKIPEESFRRAITAHVRGMNGRRPFDEEQEKAILKVLRKKERWNCFDSEQSIGKLGYQKLGFHEEKKISLESCPSSVSLDLKKIKDQEQQSFKAMSIENNKSLKFSKNEELPRNEIKKHTKQYFDIDTNNQPSQSSANSYFMHFFPNQMATNQFGLPVPYFNFPQQWNNFQMIEHDKNVQFNTASCPTFFPHPLQYNYGQLAQDGPMTIQYGNGMTPVRPPLFPMNIQRKDRRKKVKKKNRKDKKKCRTKHNDTGSCSLIGAWAADEFGIRSENVRLTLPIQQMESKRSIPLFAQQLRAHIPGVLYPHGTLPLQVGIHP